MSKSNLAHTHSTIPTKKAFEKGDNKAFEQIVIKYEKLVFNLVFRILKDYHQTCDLSQEIFLRIFNKLHTLNDITYIKTWIYRIAINYCYNYLKNRSKLSQLTSPLVDEEYLLICKNKTSISYSPELTYYYNSVREQLQEAIASLPPIQSKVIILFHYEQLSYKVIADALNISTSNVGLYLFRARKEIKKKLKNKPLFPDDYSSGVSFTNLC